MDRATSEEAMGKVPAAPDQEGAGLPQCPGSKATSALAELDEDLTDADVAVHH